MLRYVCRFTSRFMYRDTVYILSGIIDSREQDVRDALEPHFEVIDSRNENGWVAMAAQPHKDSAIEGVDLNALMFCL